MPPDDFNPPFSLDQMSKSDWGSYFLAHGICIPEPMLDALAKASEVVSDSVHWSSMES